MKGSKPEAATAGWGLFRAPPAHESAIEAHRGRLPDDEWSVRDGIPVTSPFRTIFDLAAVVKMRELERAFHEAEAREVTDRVSLPMLLERYPGRRGSKNLKILLEGRGAGWDHAE
jgi:hypothetical protein